MIGSMRHRVHIQRRTTSQDDFGGFDQNWQTEAERWGELSPLSGREFWNAQQVQSNVTHRVRLRYFEGLSTQHRLRIDDRDFEVSSVVNLDGRKRIHDVMVIEVV